MQTPARRARIVRLGAWLVLVLALLPNVSYMGHWPEMAGNTDDHHDDGLASDATDEAADEHAAHCHIGPAHCGGGESMIGTPFVGDDTQGLILPGHENKIDTAQVLAAPNGYGTPILQPPQSA